MILLFILFYLLLIQDLWNFVARINNVVRSALQQMHGLYTTNLSGSSKEETANKKQLASFQKVHFLGLFSGLWRE